MRIKPFGIVVVLTLGVLCLFRFSQIVLAEQVGSSPESGVSSRIKTIYDSLTSSSFGSTSAGAWGDWGSMWNKIYSASIWSPDGNNTVTNTLSTKTFYNTSRTKQTGQAVVAATPSPATPAIGDASRLNTLYKVVATTSYGAESTGAWGDWGAMFNRIYSSSTWTPSDANAAIADVVTGQTFYSGNNRTIKTGTSLSNGSVCVNSSDCFTGTCTTFYQDSDSDTYGNANVTTKRCGATYTGYVTNSTDCGPSNASAYPGSATCSTTSFLNASGAASYDYNCSASGGAGTACSTILATATTWATTWNYVCMVWVCEMNGTFVKITLSGSIACGASGNYCSAYTTQTACVNNSNWDCNRDYGIPNYWSSNTSACVAVGSSTQACN